MTQAYLNDRDSSVWIGYCLNYSLMSEFGLKANYMYKVTEMLNIMPGDVSNGQLKVQIIQIDQNQGLIDQK